MKEKKIMFHEILRTECRVFGKPYAMDETVERLYYLEKKGRESEKEACKLLAVDLKDQEKLEDFRKAMQDKFEGKLDLFFSNRQYLEIVPCGVSKGSALEAFCAKMGIPIANSVSAGDENNDISMIKSAGIGCAVANARPEVKAAADYVTERDNNQAAIAEIIKKFMMVDM